MLYVPNDRGPFYPVLAFPYEVIYDTIKKREREKRKKKSIYLSMCLSIYIYIYIDAYSCLAERAQECMTNVLLRKVSP